MQLSEKEMAWAQETLDKVAHKLEKVSERSKDKIPYTTVDGVHDDKSGEKQIGWWTNGFWGGMMWQMYALTGKESYREIAIDNEKKLDADLMDYDKLDHDNGFKWLPTAVANYRVTKDRASRNRGLLAAGNLAGRYNSTGKFIRAWNNWDTTNDRTGWAIIDCMLNISLLYWASEESGDPRFRQIAMAHADTVSKNFIRPDGSVCHIVEFDPETGERVKSLGGQGYGEGSSWTRGQGWALYGFANSYTYTGKQEYLDTAKQVAHYCIANIPENGIIPIDFRQPDEPAWEDSCGACVIACGLLQVAGHVSELEKKMYIHAAYRIIKAIAQTRADWSKDCDAIVQNCSAAYHDQRHHFTMSYADYYFIEALYKFVGKGILIW